MLDVCDGDDVEGRAIMSVEPQVLRERLKLLGEQVWPIEEITGHYGFDRAAVMAIVGGAQVDLNGALAIDRWAFERKIAEARWLSPRLAAAELCLTEASVRWLMDQAGEAGTPMADIPRLPMRELGGQRIVLGSMLSGWVQEVTDFHGVWSSITRRAERLRGALDDRARSMGEADRLEPLWDVVAHRYARMAPTLFPEAPTLAWAWCAVSREPISPAHAEILWLAPRGKPVSLDPDRVGWHVLMACPDIRLHVIGSQESFQGLEDEVRHPQEQHA